MKIKKKTSVMMIAAATAAVVGVAAVSFAAWEGGKTNFTANATTGSATVYGFVDENPTIDLGKIVPYDQEGTFEGTTYVSVALPEYSIDAESYKVTVESETSLSLYVLVGAQQTAVPDGWSETNKGNWQKVTSTGVEFGLTATLGDAKAVNVSTTYISVMLVSDNNAEMNTGYSLTITLSK